MPNLTYVKPADGRMPRDEHGRRLDRDGAYWPDNAYTRRLLRAGDIVRATDPAQAPKPVPVPAARVIETAAAPIADAPAETEPLDVEPAGKKSPRKSRPH